MTPIKIRTNSWHWRLAHTYGNLLHYKVLAGNINSCDYIGRVFIGLLVVLGITAMASACALIVGDFLLWMFVLATVGWVSAGPLAAVFVGACGLAAIVGSYLGIKYLINRLNRNPEPNALVEILKANHSKICRPITLIEDDHAAN